MRKLLCVWILFCFWAPHSTSTVYVSQQKLTPDVVDALEHAVKFATQIMLNGRNLNRASRTYANHKFSSQLQTSQSYEIHAKKTYIYEKPLIQNKNHSDISEAYNNKNNTMLEWIVWSNCHIVESIKIHKDKNSLWEQSKWKDRINETRNKGNVHLCILWWRHTANWGARTTITNTNRHATRHRQRPLELTTHEQKKMQKKWKREVKKKTKIIDIMGYENDSSSKWEKMAAGKCLTLRHTCHTPPEATESEQEKISILLPVYARLCATANFISISILIYDCDCYVWGNNRSQILVSLWRRYPITAVECAARHPASSLPTTDDDDYVV